MSSEALDPLLGQLLHEILAQPGLILAPVFEGGIGTVPGAAEGGELAQFGKGVGGATEQQGIQEIKLGILPLGQAVLVDRLTKRL